MPNNNHHRIINSFTSLLSSVILKFSILAGCRTAGVCGHRNLWVFIHDSTSCDFIQALIILGLLCMHVGWKSVCFFVSSFLHLLCLCTQAAIYAKMAGSVRINVFSLARLWHRGIYHASLFVLHGWAPTNQSPLPLMSNLGAIATLPVGALNWSEAIKERLWQNYQKVKGHELWSPDGNANYVGC